ncbi:MAG: DJ-1/PfpI family protein [Thermoleophilia bacterium]|nr:DJ-1/PfpI family protein [Thermoleophilia bacterium]
MEIAIPIYDGFTALDAVGPYSVLHLIPGAEVRWLGQKTGPARDELDASAIVADGVWEDCMTPDILVVPGGSGNRYLIGDERLSEWLRAVHEQSLYTTSVCTGSLLLAGAGILDGLEATTHWLAMEQLEELGAKPSPNRVVEQGKVITAAGVSSGIDMALRLTELLHGPELAQAIQLAIEYDPQPPFDAGAPHKAPVEIVEAVRARLSESLNGPT